MTWGVVMKESSIFCNIWPHANDPFSEPASIEGLPERCSLPFKNDLCNGHAEDFQLCYQKWEQHLHPVCSCPRELF